MRFVFTSAVQGSSPNSPRSGDDSHLARHPDLYRGHPGGYFRPWRRAAERKAADRGRRRRAFGATLLAGAFSQGALGNMISIEKVERRRRPAPHQQGRRVRASDYSRGTSLRRCWKARPLNLQLVRNPAQRILPDIIEEVLSMLTDAAFYFQIVAGPQLRDGRARARPAMPPSPGFRCSSIIQIVDLRKYLSPPLIQLETKVIEDKTDKPGGFAALMLPGMIYMAVFFIAGGLATDVWRERTFGALAARGHNPRQFPGFSSRQTAGGIPGCSFAGWHVRSGGGAFPG